MKRITKRTDNSIQIGDIEYTQPKELVDALLVLSKYEDSDLSPDEFKESSDYILGLNKRLRPFFDKYAEGCNYHIELPNIGLCCNAYSQSKRNDGKHWSHYPLCNAKDCPKLYPELLKDAELEGINK